MPVNPADCRTILRSTGGNSFTFTFRIFPNSHKKHTINIFLLAADGTTTQQHEGIDYTVDWDPQGGIATFKNAVPSGDFVVMYSNVPFTQDLQFVSGTQIDGYIFTNTLDKITMQILQLKCRADSAVHTKIDPATGVIPQVTINKLEPDKILASDHAGKAITPTAYSLGDFLALKAAMDIALAAAQASQFAAKASENASKASENASKTSQVAALASQTAAEKAKTDTQLIYDHAKIDLTNIVTIGTRDLNNIIADGTHDLGLIISNGATALSTQAAQATNDLNNLIASGKTELNQIKTDVNQLKTDVNNVWNTNIKPVADLLKAPLNVDDILWVDVHNNWVKTSGKVYVDGLLKHYLADGQVLWRDKGVIEGKDVSTLGGGGTSFDFSTIFNGQVDGTAPVTDSSQTDKYSMQIVPAIKVPNAANANKLVGYNSAGTGFVAIDKPTKYVPTGLGADYTAPVTLGTAPNALKQMSVMCADKDTAADRADKIGRISQDGSLVEYEVMPKGDTILHIEKVDPATLVSTTLHIPAGQNIETFKDVQLHYNTQTVQWELILGDSSMGGSNIPTPSPTGLQFLGTEKLINGVGYHWYDMLMPIPTTADDGKVPVFNGLTGKFEFKTPLADTALTRELIGETGLTGAPLITFTDTDVTIHAPFDIQFADSTTFLTVEHNQPNGSDVVVTMAPTYGADGNNHVLWIYADPGDGFKYKVQESEPTVAQKFLNVYIAEVYMTLSKVAAVRPIYNELAHKEYVLRELGDAIGTTARGVHLYYSAAGLVATKTATLHTFLARKVPDSAGNMFNSSKLFIKDLTVFKGIIVKAGVIDNTEITDFLVKKYVDGKGIEQPLSAGNTSVTVHYIYAPAKYDHTTGNVTAFYLVLGSNVYDSISAAKEDLATADSIQEIPSWITKNCVLLAKLFVRYDADKTNKATFSLLNVANLSTKGVSIVHNDILPDVTGVVDGTPLIAKSGALAFETGAAALTITDPTLLKDGDIVSVQGGHAVGVDPQSIGFDLQHLDKKLKFEFVIVNTDNLSSNLVIPAGDAKIKVSSKIKSIGRNASGGIDHIIITMTENIFAFDRIVVMEKWTGNQLSFLPVFVDNTKPDEFTIKIDQIPNFTKSNTEFRFVIYYY